jgi:putative molybdopterin biosynthesis protein
MTLIQVLESRREALTVQEVADLLGVSDKHIYEMIADGRLPAFRVGKSIRLDPQDVADWLRAKRPVAAHTGKQKTSQVDKRINQSHPGNGNARLQGVARKKINAMRAAAAMDASSERQSHSGD